MPEIWIFLKIILFDYDPDSCLRRNDFDCELGMSVPTQSIGIRLKSRWWRLCQRWLLCWK